MSLPVFMTRRSLTRLGGILCGVWLVALTCAIDLPASDPAHLGVQDEDSVKLTIDYGDSKPKRVIEDIPWREGMTVYDAMTRARRIDREFAFRHRGSRDTLFILSIDGVENEGARGDNWIFRVDEKLGDRSCGAFEIKAGQHVVWRFGEYQ